MIFTAFVKLHSAYGFKQSTDSDFILKRFQSNRFTEVTQRVFEYKALREAGFNAFTRPSSALKEEIEEDLDLDFLNYYLEADDSEEYDREAYNNKRGRKNETSLNTEAYQGPDIISTKALINESNNIMYENKNHNLTNSRQLQDKLKSREGGWTTNGYVKNEIKKPEKTFISAVQSHDEGKIVEKNVMQGDSRYSGFTGGSSSKQSSNDYTAQPYTRKEKEIFDPKKEQKEELMNSLFKGKTTFGGKQKKPAEVKPKIEKKQVVEKKTENEKVSVSQTSVVDIDDIFSSSKPVSSTSVNQTSANPMKNVNDIFDALGLAETKSDLTKDEIENLELDLETFGNLWTSMEKYQISFSTKCSISNPEQFLEHVFNACNFYPIDTTENEAISAATVRGNSCLIHATLGKGKAELLVLAEKENLRNDLKKFICDNLN